MVGESRMPGKCVAKIGINLSSSAAYCSGPSVQGGLHGMLPTASTLPVAAER